MKEWLLRPSERAYQLNTKGTRTLNTMSGLMQHLQDSQHASGCEEHGVLNKKSDSFYFCPFSCTSRGSIQPSPYTSAALSSSRRRALMKYTIVTEISREASQTNKQINKQEANNFVLNRFPPVKTPCRGSVRAKPESYGAPKFTTPLLVKTNSLEDNMSGSSSHQHNLWIVHRKQGFLDSSSATLSLASLSYRPIVIGFLTYGRESVRGRLRP